MLIEAKPGKIRELAVGETSNIRDKSENKQAKRSVPQFGLYRRSEIKYPAFIPAVNLFPTIGNPRKPIRLPV